MGNWFKEKYREWKEAPQKRLERSNHKYAYANMKPKTVDGVLLRKVQNTEQGKLLNTSKKLVTAVGGLSACMVYAIFRRQLNVYEGFVIGNVVMGGTAMIFTHSLRKHYFQVKILKGDLSCQVCAMVQGGIFQALGGCVIPTIMSFSFSAILATKFEYINIPSFSFRERPTKEFKNFWYPKFKQIRRPLALLLLIQLAVGAAVAYKELEVVNHLKRNLSKEEITRVWQEAIATLDL